MNREITFNELFKRMKGRPKIIVETGTIRDAWAAVGDGHSTIKFANYVIENGGEFYSVDNSPDAVKVSKACVKENKRVHIVCDDSLHFLENFKEEIDILYLDSANDKHLILDEAKIAINKLHKDSIILIDDAGKDSPPISQKGKLVIPWLEKNGWKKVMDYYQVLFIKEMETI